MQIEGVIIENVSVQSNGKTYVFTDFYVQKAHGIAPGWWVYGRNKEKYGANPKTGEGNYISRCAGPDVKPRKHRGWSNIQRRGFRTKREAQAIADRMNELSTGL